MLVTLALLPVLFRSRRSVCPADGHASWTQGLDLWPYLSGAVKKSPRTEVFADSVPFGVLLMEIDGHKWKLFDTPAAPDENGLVAAEDGLSTHGVPPPASHGDVPVACWMGPQVRSRTSLSDCLLLAHERLELLPVLTC